MDRLISIEGELVAATKYGENPWQNEAGLYKTNDDDPLAVHKFQLMGGTEPSFNNNTDLDRLLQVTTHVGAGTDINDIEASYIAAAAKHGNACGLAISDNRETAVEKMLTGDSRAIFGGSVLLNFAVDQETTELLLHYGVGKGKRLLDTVIAPKFSEEALDALDRKGGKLRALANTALSSLDRNSIDTSPRIRPVRGGFQVQGNYNFILNLGSDDLELEKRGPSATSQQEADMVVAWAIGSTSNSNTVTLVKDGQLIGNGVGQQDRVSVAELAVKRAIDAGHDIEGASAYSDSFFPFRDGADVLIRAGIKAVFTSSGSVQDKKVFGAFEDAGTSVYSMPDRKVRGFFGH